MMIYSAQYGIVRPFVNKIVSAFGITTPILAVIFIVAALFSSATYFAKGSHPELTLPARNNPGVKPTTSPSSNLASQPAPPSQPAVQPGGATTGSAQIMAPSTTPTAGGTLSTGSASGGSVSSGGSTSTGLITPTTVTVPAIDVQAGDKTVLSTSSTSVTVN